MVPPLSADVLKTLIQDSGPLVAGMTQTCHPRNMTESVSSLMRPLCSKVPLIDVRAPIEFDKGAFSSSVNRPILNNDERARVGICYKEHGQETAKRLGHRLVCGDIKDERIASWQAVQKNDQRAMLYCWRGGLRSKIAEQWMREAGTPIQRIPGGFKALRRASLEAIEQAAQRHRFVILSGRTGSGKTPMIVELDQAVDLEGAANHRGSAFGYRRDPQPSMTTFTAELAVAFWALRQKRSVILEDESATIGRLGVPPSIREEMVQAPVVVVEVPLEERVQHIFDEYVQEPKDEGESAHETSTRLRGALARVKKRLGLERYRSVDDVMARAFSEDEALHFDWIRTLVVEYYDPMYDYQLKKKQERVVLKGDRHTMMQALSEVEKL